MTCGGAIVFLLDREVLRNEQPQRVQLLKCLSVSICYMENINKRRVAWERKIGWLSTNQWFKFWLTAFSIKKSLSACYLSERCKLLSHAEKQLGALPRLPGASIGWAGVDPPRRVGGSDTKPKPRTSFQAYSCLPSLHQPPQQVLPTIEIIKRIETVIFWKINSCIMGFSMIG